MLHHLLYVPRQQSSGSHQWLSSCTAHEVDETLESDDNHSMSSLSDRSSGDSHMHNENDGLLRPKSVSEELDRTESAGIRLPRLADMSCSRSSCIMP